MYITKVEKKKINEINEYVSKYSEPKEFNKWLDSFKYDIAFKKGKTCKCGNCEYEFLTKNKINQFIFCPKCKIKLLIKRYDIRNYEDKNYFCLLQKYSNERDKKYIVRTYEMRTHWTYYSVKTRNTILEIERQLLASNGALGFCTIISTMKKNTSGYLYIEYWNDNVFWKPSPYSNYSLNKKFFPGNVDEVLKAKYFKVGELINNVERVNICDIIAGVKSNNYSLELLIKSKLYNLALYYYDFKIGKFENTFGLDKSYLQFMIDNNISKDDLDTLKKIKIKDIQLIRYLNNFYWRLDEILKYCKPYDFYKYNIDEKLIYEYLDYLCFAKELRLDLTNKKYLYPVNIREEHDKLQNIIEIKKSKKINKKIMIRWKNLKGNTFKDKKYIIFPASSVSDLINESNQMNNCVKTYAERYANGICDIYFMRLLSSQKESLVTIEVRNNKVVQKRTKNNQITNKSQNLFIKKWEKRLGGMT